MIGDLVGEVDVVARVFDNDFADGLISAAVGGESVQAAGRQQHGPIHTQRALVAQQPLVVTAAVVRVLMQIDDFLPGLADERLAGQGGDGERGGGRSQKLAAGEGVHESSVSFTKVRLAPRQGDFFLSVVKTGPATYAAQGQ